MRIGAHWQRAPRHDKGFEPDPEDDSAVRGAGLAESDNVVLVVREIVLATEWTGGVEAQKASLKLCEDISVSSGSKLQPPVGQH